ncbi:MAG: hypothetical protein CL478_12705 [Acidobacteria bacterium]|nr:hypothetical protein [Acidobacteriota bacterium]
MFQVDPSVSDDVIRSVYSRLILLHHPDRNAGVDIDNMALRLNNAYAVLGDPVRRAAYDRQLLGKEEEAAAEMADWIQAREARASGRFSKLVWISAIAGVVAIIAIIVVVTSVGGGSESSDQDPLVVAPPPTPTTIPTPRPTDVVSVAAPTPNPTHTPSASFYLDNGTALMRNGNFVQAIEEFTNAIELFPNYGYGYQIRGHTYFQMGQYQQALGDYAIAIQLDPSDKSIYRDRGLTHFRLEQYHLAIQDFDQAIQLDPEYAVVLNLRSLATANCMIRRQRCWTPSKPATWKPNIARHWLQ